MARWQAALVAAAVVVVAVVVTGADNGWVNTWQTMNSSLTYCGGNLSNTKTNYSDDGNITLCDICTLINGQLMVTVKYKSDKNENKAVDVYVPGSATINAGLSACASKTGERTVVEHPDPLEPAVHVNLSTYRSYAAIDFYDGDARLVLYFSNDSYTDLSPGWCAWSIYRIEFTMNLTRFQTQFVDYPADKNWHFYSEGQMTTNMTSRWWRKLCAVSQSTYNCMKLVGVNVSDDLDFSMQNVLMIAALNINNTDMGTGSVYPPNMCNYDYEKDDLTAVIIGTVQTGFTLATLLIYFIYLKFRGPVEVPKWIIEPAMRNADVKPIEDEHFERRLTQLSDNNAGDTGLHQRQNGAPVDKF